MMGDQDQACTSNSATGCKQELLSLAGEISGHVSISDLASYRCLGISLDDVNLNASDTDRDKIYTLFSLWMSANPAEGSMAKLLTHLEKLNNASIDNIIKKYREEPQQVSLSEANTLSASHCSGLSLQCSAAPSSGSSIIESNPILSEDSERMERFPLGVCASVAEASGLSGVSQQLICSGQRTDHLTMRSKPETFAKVDVTRKIEKKEKEFSNLLCNVRRHLQANCTEEDIQDMKVYLTSLSMSIKEDTSPRIFTSQQAEIIVYNTLPQIFQWLTLNGCWSFLNFYLLESIVDRYGNDDLKQKVTKFEEDMEIFKRDMKLADFLPAWSGRCPHVPASGFEPIILRVNKDWKDCTLAKVAEMEGFLESRFLINRFILRFANGRYGSVVIMWLVPSHAIAYLKERIMAIGTKSFSEEGIVEMTFSDNLTIKASSLELQPKPCTPIKSKSLQNGEKGFKTLLDRGNYDELYATSTENTDFFWGTLAKQFLQWYNRFEKVEDCSMEEGEIKWFTGGKLNVSVNCVDRHATKYPDRVALIWEKDNPGETERVTYKELLKKVCQISNVLKSRGVKKGDTVAIYMPTCPLAVASMLACARIGAIHSVLFSKFAWIENEEERARFLRERINGAKVIITANTSPLSGRDLPLKESLEVILDNPDSEIQHILVYKRTDKDVPMKLGRDEWLEEAMEEHPTECEPESMDSEDDLFVMFTSGVTGTAKGIVHSQAGYLLHVAVTHKYYFDYQPGEIFACTADIGWITGHSYVVYGPLCNGATTVLLDNTATYPSATRYWELITDLGINHFYTTPSVIQKLMSQCHDKGLQTAYDLPSLRIIASVGECLNSDTWQWFHKNFGNGKCHLIDTWWQTELGGIAIAPHPKLSLKPGCIMKPSFGVKPCLINKDEEQATGELYLEAPLPGMGRRLTGAAGQETFRNYYFKTLKKLGKVVYYTYDIVHKDEDGDYQVYGRVNDARYRGELLNLPCIEGAANASHVSIEKTVLVVPPDNETAEEHEIVAHVKLKDKLTRKEGEDVSRKVKASIEKISGSQIKTNNLRVQLYDKEEKCDTVCSRETFSGKFKRQSLRTSTKELSYECQPSIPRDPWRQSSQDNCVVAK